MNSGNHNDVTEFELELAKRIACAVMSYQLRITYQTCWNRYIKDTTTISDKWIKLAKLAKQYLIDGN